MTATFDNLSVSIVLAYSDSLPYEPAKFQEMLRAAITQDHQRVEVIVVDDRGPAATPGFLPAGVPADAIRHVPGTFANQAAAWNAGIEAAGGDFLLILFNRQEQIVLRQSAVQTMLMAASRGDAARRRRWDDEAENREQCPPVIGMVYADYERIEADGKRADVHLLNWHEGRLRDTVDFGGAILFRTAALRAVGAFDDRFSAVELYDLRLRISERYGVAHIANRYAGSLYTVAAPSREHNVFDYLLAGKDAQLEAEQACTEHLKRTRAYLAPGAHVGTIEYTDHENDAFAECLASVVTPVNDRPQFIGRAIESVQAQTVRNVEMIVVVNGGRNDPTADAVRRYMAGGDKHDPGKPNVRLIVLDVNNLGLCLNAGIAAARGKYYVQLDSDDRLKPDAVEKLVSVFDSDPTIGMVIGSYEVWTLDERSGELRRNEEVPVVTHGEWTAENGRNNLLRINGAGAPRAAHIKAIRDAGWFGVNDSPHSRNYGEDYDLVLRISEQYAIGRVWDPIYDVIRHSGGTDHAIDQATIDRNDDAKDAMRIEALHRRRLLNSSTPDPM